MRTIIHDLKDFKSTNDNDIIITDNNSKNCIGCFNCWLKTPFKCIHKDNLQYNGKNIFESDELIIISECLYGAFSSKVKKILERSISYVLPFFTIREKEIHHKERSKKKIKLSVYLYGNIDNLDKKTIINLIKRNALNLNADIKNICFYNDYKEIII